MFEHLMHSWVEYELVKVLLKYGLSPKLRGDLNEWSPDFYELFSYFGYTMGFFKKSNSTHNSLRKNGTLQLFWKTLIWKENKI